MTVESIRRCLIVLVIFLAPGSVLLAQHRNFEIVGPGGGGAMFNATVSPHNSNDVLVSCDMTGSYISHDGGRSWRMFNLRGVARFFAFDPNRPRTVYASTGPLWRSVDAGDSWQLVWPHPSAIKEIRMNSDHADEQIIAEPDPVGEFTALAIDPENSDSLIATTVKNGTPFVFVSGDGGISWQKETDLPAPGQKVWIDPSSAKKQRNIYVGEERGFMIRHGGKWQERPSPEKTRFKAVSAGFSPKSGPVFYAIAERGIWVSRDGAASWSSPSIGDSRPECRAVAASLRRPEVAYVSCSNLSVAGKKYSGVVARTRDAGRTFGVVWKEGRVAPANVHDAWITDQLGVGWAEHPLTLTVAEQDPNLCYATDYGRTLVSTDGGENWNAVYSKRVPGANWTSAGLDVTTNYGYFLDPFDARRHFIAYTDIGLFLSEDGGHSWLGSASGIPQEWRNTTYWLVFDPAVRGKIWGVMSGTHDLPRPKMWRHTSTATYKGGVCISTDGGRTWKPSNTGMAETAPTHILLDPSSRVGKRVLWVAAMGKGVYKSSDDGVTWTLKNAGIEQKDPLAWRLTRTADGTLYVVIARRSENGSIGNSGDGAIYKSTNGAESWQFTKMPEGVNGPNGLASDPEDANRLYLAAWARASGTHGDGGGIFLSRDAGKSWKQVLDRDRHVYDITIDPRNPAILYAAGFESSAWRSLDRGEHWSRIGGFNFKWAHRVIPDPQDPEKVYITTFGGSIWHGTVNAENRLQDIVTPELAPGR
jgi:photosystem II stability/assembly factor-like uncharacterized protein